MRFSFFFAWYDLWIGAYWQRDRGRLYVCPLPCCCLMIQFPLSPMQRLLLQLQPDMKRWGPDEEEEC